MANPTLPSGTEVGGLQPGYPLPDVVEGGLDAWTGTLTFGGKQPGDPDPTVHAIPRLKTDGE